MTLVFMPWGGYWKQWLSQHYKDEYKQIGKTMIIPKTLDEYDKIEYQGIIENRTMVTMIMMGYVSPEMIAYGKHPDLSPRLAHKGGQIWYRSKEIVEGYSGLAGFLSRKDWRFNEVVNFQLYFETYQLYDDVFRK